MYKKEIILPTIVKDLILKKKNKTTRTNYLKIYSVLYLKFNERKNYIDDYISIPSAYLRTVNYRYSRFIKELKENKVIEVLSYKLGKEYYNTDSKQSKRYRPIINIHNGESIIVELENKHMEENWYKITKESLDYLNLKTSIKRCIYGRRLHTPITHRVNEDYNSYKGFFTNRDERFFTIDATACQPNLLKLILKERKIGLDHNYVTALNEDFYDYLVSNSEITTRNDAKMQYCIWQNGDKKKSKRFANLFPLVSKRMAEFKSVDPNTVGRLVQKKESSIFIDELLDNVHTELGIDFCLTVHDSLIVREQDALKVYDWVKNKVPYLDFKLELIV